ncbi:MAG TPA: hypothetical protein VFX33_12225 [Actinomycetales bacterium]|nr:hypothetical protein [Actinomycetales bacterium]
MTESSLRKLALALAVAAPIVVAVTTFAAVDGGFRWYEDGTFVLYSDRGGHIYLRLLAHPLLGVAVAVVMLAVAAHLTVQQRVLRVAAETIAGIVAVAALCLAMLMARVSDMFELSMESTVATSPDFKLVSYRSPGLFSSGCIVLRLQTREGLLSREGGEELGAFIEPESHSDPEWLFDRASFTGKDEVTVVTRDGTRWQIRFNTQTLAPVNPLDRCTDAPDPFGF